MAKTAKSWVKEAVEDGRVRLVRNEIVNVGTTNTQLLLQNGRRVKVVVINLSASIGYADYRPNPSASRGYQLGTNGGGLLGVFEEDGEALYQELFAAVPDGDGTEPFQIYEWEAYQ